MTGCEEDYQLIVDVFMSPGPEDSMTVPSHTLDSDLQGDSESSVVSDMTQHSAEQSTSSGTSSRRSSHLTWRERLLMGAGTSPEPSEAGM